MKNPKKYLPEEYLVAVGLAQPETYRCDDCDIDFGTDYDAWLEHREEVDTPRIQEKWRLENDQRLAEMQAERERRTAEQELKSQIRRAEFEETMRQHRGSYFSCSQALFAGLADLFDTDCDALTKTAMAIVQDAHSYQVLCKTAEVAEVLHNGWQECADKSTSLWPGLKLTFGYPGSAEKGRTKDIWIEETS